MYSCITLYLYPFTDNMKHKKNSLEIKMITRRLFKFLERKKKKFFKKNKSFIVFIAAGSLMFWLFGSFN